MSDETAETATEEITETAAAPAEGPSTDDFAKMLESDGASMPGRTPKTGEKVKCRVVGMNDDKVFVSFGGKSEGSLSRAEFDNSSEEEGAPVPLPAEGDEIEAWVLSSKGGEVVLSTKLTRRDQSRAAIEDAHTAGVPVEGRVGKLIKGGFEVRVSGLRGFCPLSQIDLRWPKEPEEHVGKIYSFKVVEYKDKGRNIILSRRALLEADRVTRREELKKKILVGNLVTGRVRNVQPFGAFVELGGVDGLIPVSEMAWERVANAAEVLSEGQEVTAKVIGIDWDKERISLSLRSLAADPWLAAAANFKEGDRVKGKVVRLADFGAFVALEPGVDGMIHVSALGTANRVKHPREALTVGDEVEAEVLSIDAEKKRISLSMDYKRTEGLGDLPRVGEVLTVIVEKIADFGIFVKLDGGHQGVIPNAELNIKKNSESQRPPFIVNDEVEAKVTEVSQGGKRIRLSIRELAREKVREERKEFETYKGDDKANFGTLGDLLKQRTGK